MASRPHPRGSAPLASVWSCPGLTSRCRTPGSLEGAASWGGVLSYNGGRLGGGWTVGTRRLYLARNPPPPGGGRAMFLPRDWPAGARCGGLLLSNARAPGPRGRRRLSRARASCSLGGMGQRRSCHRGLADPPTSPRLEETSHTRRSPSGGSATLPPSLYGDQAWSVRWRLGRNKVSGRNRDEEGRERRETQRQRDR